MTPAEARKILRRVERHREKVLSPKAMKYLKEVAKDAQASREFLWKAGIYDKKGHLKYHD